MSFLEGLLGIEFDKPLSPEEIAKKEEKRLFSRRIRKELEEQQELVELQDFILRQPYSKLDKSRPSNFEEYIGQKDTKEMVKILLQAGKLKKTPFPHSLFWGEAGLGKSSISYLIAKEVNANFVITSGGQLETKDDLLNVFRKFSDNRFNILFIDEIHALPRKISEMIYSAMEDFRFDYTTKRNQVVNLSLPPFTLLGATTDLAKLLIPIRQRFQNRFHLTPYTTGELSQIIQNYLTRVNYYPTSNDTLREIALRSRSTARYAVNYTKNLIDYCYVKHIRLNEDAVREYFKQEGVDNKGLTKYDREYLKVLLNTENFKAGLTTIVKYIGMDKRTVEQEIEPFLLRKNFIVIGSRGRELTGPGFDYITEVT